MRFYNLPLIKCERKNQVYAFSTWIMSIGQLLWGGGGGGERGVHKLPTNCLLTDNQEYL
jgi:hypothetical protein